MRKYLIPVCLAFIAGFATKGLIDYSCKQPVRGHLDLAFNPGDRVTSTNHRGEHKIDNAPGTVVGVAYNPIWREDKEVYYWVEFDSDVEQGGGHCASGKKASEIKLLK